MLADRNRNCMCRLREVDYRGVRQVYLENQLLRVTVVTGKGADITELLYKPLDLDVLWHSFLPVENPSGYAPSRVPAAGSFLPLYEGGWQELFPSYGAPCTYRGAEYGLHGEVGVVPWEYRIERDTPEEICLHVWVRTPSTPYLLERWMSLKTGDPTLYIRERVTNESPVSMAFMWGHHPVLGPPFLDESCEIRLPKGDCQAVTLTGSGVLRERHQAAWPRFPAIAGGEEDLSRIQPPAEKRYREYGIRDLPKGECTVWSNRHNAGFQLGWDIGRFPYLWIWEPDCGAPDHPWYGRNYCLGIEPWSHLEQGGLAAVADRGEAIPLDPWESMETAITAGIIVER